MVNASSFSLLGTESAALVLMSESVLCGRGSCRDSDGLERLDAVSKKYTNQTRSVP